MIRKLSLFLGLIVTLYFSFFHRYADDGLSEARQGRGLTNYAQNKQSSINSNSQSEISSVKARNYLLDRKEVDYPDLFAGRTVRSVTMPAPTPTIVQPQTVVAAPDLPFRYLGRQVVDGEPELFLSYGERFLNVKKNMIIDGIYLVSEITAGEIRFTYLPLQKVQSLIIQDSE